MTVTWVRTNISAPPWRTLSAVPFPVQSDRWWPVTLLSTAPPTRSDEKRGCKTVICLNISYRHLLLSWISSSCSCILSPIFWNSSAKLFVFRYLFFFIIRARLDAYVSSCRVKGQAKSAFILSRAKNTRIIVYFWWHPNDGGPKASLKNPLVWGSWASECYTDVHGSAVPYFGFYERFIFLAVKKCTAGREIQCDHNCGHCDVLWIVT